jgi:hypothetical protein
LTQSSTWKRASSIAVALLGLSVWVQLCAPAVFAVSSPSPWIVFTAFVPLLVGAVSLSQRSGAGCLLLFPVSILPALVGMPEITRAALYTPFAMLRVVLALALYLAATGAWLSGTQAVFGGTTVEHGSDQAGNTYRWFVLSRGAVLVILAIVPIWAVYLDGPIVATIAMNHPGGERVAQSFIAMIMFFVWSVVAYTNFVVPLLNLEYDRRKVRRKALDSVKQTTVPLVLKRLGIESGIIVFLVVILLIV